MEPAPAAAVNEGGQRHACFYLPGRALRPPGTEDPRVGEGLDSPDPMLLRIDGPPPVPLPTAPEFSLGRLSARGAAGWENWGREGALRSERSTGVRFNSGMLTPGPLPADGGTVVRGAFSERLSDGVSAGGRMLGRELLSCVRPGNEDWVSDGLLGEVPLMELVAGGVTLGRVTLGGVTLGRVTLGRLTAGGVTAGGVTLGRVTLGGVTERTPASPPLSRSLSIPCGRSPRENGFPGA